MARSMDYTSRFSLPADRVFAAWADRDYWEDLMIRMRELTPVSTVEDFRVDDAGVDLRLTQVIERHTLPAVAQTVMHSDLVITRIAHYGPHVVAGITTGDFSATIPGAPGSLTGQISLFDEGEGSIMRTTPQAEVNIPLLGGKLEEMMLANIVDLLEVESEFTEHWLRARA